MRGGVGADKTCGRVDIVAHFRVVGVRPCDGARDRAVGRRAGRVRARSAREGGDKEVLKIDGRGGEVIGLRAIDYGYLGAGLVHREDVGLLPSRALMTVREGGG